ncbi:MAG: hypothetical protein OCD01_03610 [Fibrobacterales bacterium]
MNTKKNKTIDLKQYINFKLKIHNLPSFKNEEQDQSFQLLEKFIDSESQIIELLPDHHSPVDLRIQNFINETFADCGADLNLELPMKSFELDQPGVARALSLPPDKDFFESHLVKSYRTLQGVLHNPRHDRRTTKGVFHVSEGGLPISEDKMTVPKASFAKILEIALQPPADSQRLPYTSTQDDQAETFVSLLLTPPVSPEIPGFQKMKMMEVRLFAPGGLVSNLDFAESVFGNAGNPYVPSSDLGLNFEQFTGNTGCIILAPHLNMVTKKEVGLPTYDQATEKQRAQGMCWKEESELYNDGSAFKICFRDENGIMITIIADNYFGYTKKEVKTQISFATNMCGQTEEEHAGGALVFQRFNWGDTFSENTMLCERGDYPYEEFKKLYSYVCTFQEEGHGIDNTYPDIYYIPNDAVMSVSTLSIEWELYGQKQSIKLSPDVTYIHPSGYKLNLEKHPKSDRWYIVGTVAEGVYCHKPATVSGGGKSEISKSISEIITYKSFFVQDLQEDLVEVEKLLDHEMYKNRFKNPDQNQGKKSRPILSDKRTLGSVIKLLTTSEDDYTEEYNEWLNSISTPIRNLVFTLKRFYRHSMKDDWKKYFQVDYHDGEPGHELRLYHKPVNSRYLRVGSDLNDTWQTFRLRQDFIPAFKLQKEDDITCSSVFDTSIVPGVNESLPKKPYKFTQNCERMLFQRPDEAIHKGVDLQTEDDFANTEFFACNYEPLVKADAIEDIEDVIEFTKFSDNMKGVYESAAQMSEGEFFVSTTHPRLVNGAPTKNVRYLQHNPEIYYPQDKYLTNMSARMFRKLPMDKPVQTPVEAILIGRRNNNADKEAGIKALSVYNPLHYQELPELFMDYIASLSGKSPSTTGFGSEGALTKAPFNALQLIVDLNNTLVSNILTEDDTFSTAAGFIGSEIRVDHDITFLVPELWCRFSHKERKASYLIEKGFLEKIPDMEYEGKTIPSSILGYRITSKFVHEFFGRIFASPTSVFKDNILKPETQDMEDFAGGVLYIAESQKTVAENYFKDGSIDVACPPLKALLNIMVKGSYEGKDLHSPEFRALFSKEALLSSDWYTQRLKQKQAIDIAHMKKALAYIKSTKTNCKGGVCSVVDYDGEIEKAKTELARVSTPEYLASLKGTIGADPFYAVK